MTDAYDEVAYPTLPQPETHPDRLARVAWVAGLEPPLAERSRVLEIGSGDAANLAPMVGWVDGLRAVGVERAGAAHARAVARRDALSLERLTLLQEDLTALDPDAVGEQDYVIAHGLYSWVDAPTRDALLSLAARVLAPNGVLFLSYNARPQWGVRGAIRDAMRSAGRDVEAPVDRVARAKAVLEELRRRAEAITDAPYRALLEREIGVLDELPEAALFHDLLADHNHAFTVHEVAEASAQAGLRRVGEMLCQSSPFADEPLHDDERTREGIRGVLENRSLRMAVLARADVTPDARDPMQWIGQGRVAGRLRRKDAETFELGTGATVRAGRPAMRDALSAMEAAWPFGVELGPLLAADEVSARDLARLVWRGHLEVRRGEARCAQELGDRPHAHPVARLDAPTAPFIAGPFHDRVPLDGLSRFLVERLDGSREVPQLVVEAAAALGRAPGELENAVRARLHGCLREGLIHRLASDAAPGDSAAP